MSMKTRGGETAAKNVMSRKGALFLCLGSFFAGVFFSNRYFDSWVTFVSFKFGSFGYFSDCVDHVMFLSQRGVNNFPENNQVWVKDFGKISL
uniref:Uncharacterized protein n=1 Tax=Rhizophora mucronata TaxID=61149 RepID=A0A2P2KQY1_RHIMU